MSKSTISIFVVIVASWIVTGTLEDSCEDLEWVEPCDGELLQVSYGRCGIRISPDEARSVPKVSFPDAEDDKKYLLIMVDPDAPSSRNPKFRYWRHYVLSDISGRSLRSGYLDGTTRTEYNGPTPPAGTGPHRYQFFLFKQFGDLKSVKGLGNDVRGAWQLRDFIRDNQLCNNLVAAYEFTAENK